MKHNSKFERKDKFMKQKLFAALLAVCMCLGICTSAYAATYIPNDVTYQNLDGRQLCIKVYTLLPDQDPEDLIERDFEYDGFLYKYSSIVKEEQEFQESSQHTETVTVTTSSKKLEDILAQLEPTMEYDNGDTHGTLALDHSTIKTEVAGYRISSYSVTATKNYTGLERNDSSYIDKTVVKDGRTLSLTNVAWSVESTALVGDELIPATYSAVATYSGTAYTSTASGYITTAEYKGVVTASGIASIKYTVTYLGSQIVMDAEEAEEPTRAAFPVIPVACCTGILLLLLFLAFLFRKNVTVYQATGNGNEYEKCGRLFLSERKPELNLADLKLAGDSMIAVEVDEKVARKLFGKTISIHYLGNEITHTVDEVKGQYWFKFYLEAPVDADALADGKEVGAV